MLRAQKAAWVTLEKPGLEGQLSVMTDKFNLAQEKADFYKQALARAEKMDTNSQRMDSTAVSIQHDLETQLAASRRNEAKLTDDLRSCQSGQKYIAVFSFAGGVATGYWARGAIGGLGSNRASYDSPFGYRPMPVEQPRVFDPTHPFTNRDVRAILLGK